MPCLRDVLGRGRGVPARELGWQPVAEALPGVRRDGGGGVKASTISDAAIFLVCLVGAGLSAAVVPVAGGIGNGLIFGVPMVLALLARKVWLP